MGELTAFSTMFFVGYISAPPTMGSFWAEALMDVMARAATAIAARSVFFMVVILCRSSSLNWRFFGPVSKSLSPVWGTHIHLRDCAESGLA